MSYIKQVLVNNTTYDVIDDTTHGENLWVVRNQVPGYLHASGTSILAQAANFKEVTSEFIPVSPGEVYWMQCFGDVNSGTQHWIGYASYTDTDLSTVVGTRSASYSANDAKYFSSRIVIPATANYLRVSYRRGINVVALLTKGEARRNYTPSSKDLTSIVDEEGTLHVPNMWL